MISNSLDHFAPFDNPEVKRKQKITATASFKAFNAVARRLLEDLKRIYPTDATIRLLSTEMDKITNDKSKMKIGALNFFKEIRKPATRSDGTDCQYVDLLAEHSDDAYREPIPVLILQGIGLATKWKAMEPAMRNALWEYVDRLIRLSAQAVFSGSHAVSEMNKLSRAVVTAAMSGHGDSPQELIENVLVQKAANEFIDSVK